jgi:YtcA family
MRIRANRPRRQCRDVPPAFAGFARLQVIDPPLKKCRVIPHRASEHGRLQFAGYIIWKERASVSVKEYLLRRNADNPRSSIVAAECRLSPEHKNMSPHRRHGFRPNRPDDVALRGFCVVGACIGLTGCDLRGAPSYSLFGAFFPAWLLCAGLGLLGSLLFRGLVISSGFEDAIPFKLLVYTAFAAGLAVWMWLGLFGDR